MEPTLFQTIHEYWVEIILFLTVTINYVRQEMMFKSSIKRLQDRDDLQDCELQTMKTELKANSAQFTQIQVDIQAIKTALEYIKQEMARK
jgi:capsid protein